jgi:hypothetical protein
MAEAMAMTSASESALGLPMSSAPNWKNYLYLPLCGLSYLKHWPK